MPIWPNQRNEKNPIFTEGPGDEFSHGKAEPIFGKQVMSDISRIEQIFLHAVSLADPAGRGAYLDSQCGSDADLRRRVDALLAAQPQAQGFLEPVTVDRTSEYQPKPEAQAIGTVIADRYTLTEVIGEGGMGTVWRAKQTDPVKRFVAIKLIKPGMDSRQVLARFEAERQALAMMDHPNIAKILDGGIHDNRPFFVMELVKGTPITEFCDARKLTTQQRLELFLPVCLAIQHAHQKGIIHRDIKPSNVLIALYDDRPVPKVIDFGVAKATGGAITQQTIDTGFGGVVGTPQYMSPEQATFNNLDIDTRSDVYSLGTLLYELLAGSPPFARPELEKRGLLEILRVVREEEPPRPSMKLSSAEARASISANRGSEPAKLSELMRGEIDWIVMKALEKDRSRRYETANGLAADVRRYLNGDAVEACPPTVGYRLRKAYRRNKTRVLTAGVISVAVLAGASTVAWQIVERKRGQAVLLRQQEAQIERSEQSATQLLERAESSLKRNQIQEAVSWIRQAEVQLAEFDDANLRERLAVAKHGLETVQRLDNAFAWRWNVAKGQVKLLPTKSKELYPAALKAHGLAVGQEPAEATVQAIRRSTIADALWVALYQWYFLEPTATGLRAVLDADDPDPLRTEIRAAVAAGHSEQIYKLTQQLEPVALNAAFAAALGMALPIEDSPRLLKAVWRRQPDSFPLAMTIAARHTEMDILSGSPVEAVGWCRLAVALRPDNAFARHCLGVALSEDGDIEGGLAEMEEAMRLAPRFQRAASLYIYSVTPSWRDRPQAARDRAFALCQQLLRINPDHQVAHAGLIELYWDRKNWREMATHYRKLFDLSIRPADQITEEYSCPEETLVMISLMGLGVEKMLKRLVGMGDLDVVFDLCIQCNAKHWGYNPERMTYWKENGGERCELLFHGVRAGVVWAAAKGQKPIPTAQREVIRRQAREWLEFLVAGGNEYLQAEAAKSWAHIHKTMNDWLAEPALASVREEAKLAELPAEERNAWQALWASVQSLRARTSAEHAPKFYRDAIDKTPDDVQLREGLVSVLHDLNQEADAVVELKILADLYRQLIAKNAKDVSVGSLAGVLWELGQRDEARKIYREKIASSKNSDDLNHFAMQMARWLAAKDRDGDLAVAAALRACELTGYKKANVIDTLATAYAEKGDFAAAVNWQIKAIAICNVESDRKQLEANLKVFQAGKSLPSDKKPARRSWTTP